MEARQLHAQATRVGLTAAVVAIVLGILGMHALNLHGSTAMAPMSGMSGMSSMSGHYEPAPAATSSDHASHVVVSAPTHPGHDMGDMVMLCAAMIVAAGFALSLLMLRRMTTSSWTFTTPRLLATVGRLVQERADAGPPAAWKFSVIRC